MKKKVLIISAFVVMLLFTGCGFTEEHLIEYVEVVDVSGIPANNVTLITMPTINIELKKSFGVEILSGTGYRHQVPLEYQEKSGFELDASILAIKLWGGLAVKDVELTGTTLQITARVANTD